MVLSEEESIQNMSENLYIVRYSINLCSYVKCLVGLTVFHILQ